MEFQELSFMRLKYVEIVSTCMKYAIPGYSECLRIWPKFKGVRHNLETHPRAMKISEITIFGALISNLNLLNRYNLWFMTYNLCQNDGFSLMNDGFST